MASMAVRFLLVLMVILIITQKYEGKTEQVVNIPYNAPVGYVVTKLKDKENVIDFTKKVAEEIVHQTQDGAIQTRRKLTDLIDTSLSLPVKNSVTNIVSSYLHIRIVGSDNFSFPQKKYIGTVRENASPGSHVKIIGHLAVTDLGYKNVTYSVQPENSCFKIEQLSYGNSHDNRIVVLKSFDRELRQNYSFLVQAESETGKTAIAKIEIHILDENDNIPKFTHSVLEVRTTSGPSWHSVVTVSATDRDLNDRISYSMDGSGDFMIDSDTGEIFSEVDYLFGGSYLLKVYASDLVGHVSAPLIIHVHVENEDSVLLFMPNSYHHMAKRATTTISKLFEIVENSTSVAALFSVATVQPRPASSTEAYGLISSSVDIFRQPDVNGNVFLKVGNRLDYEDPSHRDIKLIFNRTNMFSPGDVTILEVTLRVQDKNDEKPVFKNKPFPFLAAVSTNPGLGETVYTLYAEDPDLNSNLIYNLESGGEGKFKMVTEADPKTGDMVGKLVTTVSGPGQFVDGVEYPLVVSAQDIAAGMSPPQKSDFTLVKVLAGFRPPQLFENPFIAQVYENSGVGKKILDTDKSILVIRAKCFQDTLKNRVSFDLVEPTGRISSLFSITSKDNVETLQNLDFEDSPTQYQLNVIATELETGLKSTSEIIINVLDVNDNSPKFWYSTYTFTLSEDTPIGETALPLLVTATDRDSGVNGELEYKVSDDHFTIETKFIDNQYVGHIKVAKELDYDFTTDHQYRFNVTATDKGEIPRSGLATVIVYVENVNDEAPVFKVGTDHLYATISEEQTVGSVVTIIQATDPDDGDNVKYYFTARSTESGPFRIDPASGLITLARSLPETVPVYMLNITAYDDGACCPGVSSLSSDTYIFVEIKDTNNNQPQFPDCSYEPLVLENQNVGTFVVQVKAVDNDRGNNGNITYSIVTSPWQPKQFEVNPSNGRVVTAVKFDREAQISDRGVSVTVKAADQGQPQPLDSHCTFWVRIGDVNDNPPVFDSPSYSTSISESSTTKGARVFAVRALDKDRGKNAAIIYSLTENPGQFFRIEPDSGIIYLEKTVSGTDDINIVVKAEDQGDPPLSAYVTVSVSVIDRNNNPPSWDSSNYEREYLIKETAPIGYTIATMSASSNTPAPFDAVTFALIDSRDRTVQAIGPFRIHQDGSTVTLILKGTLNHNVQNRYELRMRVTNQGQIPLSAEIRPIIVVKDMNNEPPQFEGLDSGLSNSYKASVPENEPPGQMVLQIKAVDPDHDSPNNLVSYSILEDKNNAYLDFEIDSDSGVITTRSTFDREEADKSVYYINVKAVDGTNSDAPGHFPPNTPNSATAQVQISIADKNDNPPYFTQSSWSAQVPEQRPDDVGRIVTVSAMDKDEADVLAYSITEGNIDNVFGMKQKTGDVYVAKTLNYEVPPTKYNLTVMVSDGLFQNTASVLIEVTDVNDNEPEFDQEVYEITDVVEETVPPPDGQFLLQVFATDKDVSRQTNFRFNISGYGTSPPDQIFTIEPETGKIFLRRKLDRDLPYGRDVYQFNVIAEDEPDTPGALFGYAYVKVRPKDINDNDPKFDSKGLQGSVAEHSPAGQSVMTVVAQDFDAGENGTVFYEIDRYGNPPADPRTSEWLFQINSETGLIQTKLSDSLDRETTSQYFLQIIAKDRGVEQRSTTATVTIKIDDINDQPPVFVEKIYRVSMSENQVAGPVVTVSATDNDIDENARLTYTLEEGDRSYFSIETMPPNAGVLTVFRAVDYEEVKFFNLTVYVKDGKHQDKAYIEVQVEDYNDNAPEFFPKVKTIRMTENVPEYTSLWNCSASDADSGVNADFEYSIDRSTDEGRRFTVNSNCEVKVKRGLDGETLDREALAGLPEEKYEVHILAKDKGYPSQTGTAVLRIFVEDLNDNAPEFVLPHPPMVMEGEPPPKHVITFSARDRDTPKFGPPFRFEMVPCAENPSCDASTGVLAFNMTFDEKGANGTGTGKVTALKTFWRDDQKYHYLPIIMSDMRGRDPFLRNTGTSTLTIEIGDINNHEQKPGHKEIFVYKYDFKGIEDDLVIGNVYAEDPDDWDVKDKHYYFFGPWNMAKYFSVNFDDGSIRMNKHTPPGIHNFKAKVHDFVQFPKVNVTCTVRVIVEEITDDAIYSSGSVRLSGITAEQFVKQGTNKKSAYDKFRDLLAAKLHVPKSNVAVFSVMNGENNEYTDVRYSAHGSPWYPASMLDGIVSLDKQKFENEAGITISMVNIDMCLREVCESGGCSNILVVGDYPNYVNTNGTAFIGVSTTVKAECQCAATNYTSPPECTPGYCYNGGTCIKDEWGDVKCDCKEAGWHHGKRLQFDGPRCQMTRHSFKGGYALFDPFKQCEDSVTSIEILPERANGLIFYNGPVSKTRMDDPTDYIALWLEDGYPVLSIDHGSGAINLTVDGRDRKGIRHLQKLNDGRWHHIDIIRKGKAVTMIVDRCDMTEIDSGSDTVVDRSPCEVSGTTPDENYYLNVNTHLQLGGVYSDHSYHPYLPQDRFHGCVRNLINNGELYDLYTGRYSKGENHVNGCPVEDLVCGVNSLEGPRCGKHGICEMTDALNKQYKCTCKPGYRPAGPDKENCEIATTIRDLNFTSYMSWTLKFDFLNEEVKPRRTEVQLRFRTRDTDGILLHLPSNTEEFITLELVGGRLRVFYNLGDVKVKGDGDAVLSLVDAPASNGQWHTVYMKRIGKWFQLKMDGGEGRYYNETWGPENGHQMFSLKMYNIVAGAHVVFTKKPIAQGQDLTETCIDDIRLNGEWFPMQNSENELSYAAALDYERNVYMGCVRDDCAEAECPKGITEHMICVPLWGTYECRCPPGTYVDGYNCLPIDYCERDRPCFVGATCIPKPYPANFTCLCPSGWAGPLCNTLKAVDPATAGITTGFIIIIIVCIFIVLLVALLVFLFVRNNWRPDPMKYRLDDELEDDIRENIVNYNEEGAGEEDQNAYDISRLRKPDDVDTMHKMPYDPLTERYRPRGAGDKPDVGRFINERLHDADNDPNAPPHDSVREFINEGGNSDAGSLSSLNTSSSQEEQDYDYLNDWGPKFSKLANMYGGDEDEEDL